MLFGIAISSILYGYKSNLTYIILVFPLIYIVEKYFNNIRKYLYSLSFFYYFLIVFIYYFNFKVNKYGFFPNFDDSFYHYQGRIFLTENYSYDSIFDAVVYIFLFIADTNFSLAAINWFLATLLLGIIYKFSKLINNEFKPFFLLFLAFNMFFLEIVVMLLRDFLGLFFLLISFCLILKGKKIKYLPFAFASIAVRQTTGIIAFIFHFLYNSRFINMHYRGKSLIIILIFSGIYFFYNYIPVGFLSRGGFEGVNANFTLSDWNKTRYEFFFGDEGVSDLTAKLISLGILGAPFVLLLNIFSPLRISDFWINTDYKYLIDGILYQNYYYNIFNYKSILSTIHVVAFGFLIIPFFDGFKNLFKKNGLNFIILIFIICLMMVTYVSYQPRHKLHFLIFLPLICSYTTLPTNKIFIYGLVIDLFFISIVTFIEIVS